MIELRWAQNKHGSFRLQHRTYVAENSSRDVAFVWSEWQDIPVDFTEPEIITEVEFICPEGDESLDAPATDFKFDTACHEEAAKNRDVIGRLGSA